MKTIFRAIVAIVVLGLATLARGLPQLRIFDGTTTITVVDNGPGDIDHAIGSITWIGTIGDWTHNTISAATKPALGQIDSPWMDLAFFDDSSRAGVLTLTFTETDFINAPSSRASLKLGGTTAGSVQYDLYGAAFGPTRDTAFDMTRLLGTFGPVSNAFAFENAGQAVGSGNFSLTQVLTLRHQAAGSSIGQGDAIGLVSDTSATIAFLIIGLGSVRLLSLFGKTCRDRAAQNLPM